MTTAAIPKVLSIAGTDPSGGAGVHADLKAFSAHRAYGMAVVTALVAQTTTGVTDVRHVPPDFVAEQLETLLTDVRVDAVKIGMLGDAEVIKAVAEAIERYQLPNVVLDPVMVAKSGDRLLAAEAVEELRDVLIPRVDLITPNLPEAADLLSESEVSDPGELAGQARRLAKLGAPQVLLKGGHLKGEVSTDCLLVDGQPHTLPGQRIATTNDHGTGCTLSSAIAALRPQRPDWMVAVTEAKEYLAHALAASDLLDVGHGRGPVHHFYGLW